MDSIDENYFPAGQKILLIHTGGIQGIEGMNTKLRKKHYQINAYV
jgi:1-aminocyclopropane-1-carboxylate deaminase